MPVLGHARAWPILRLPDTSYLAKEDLLIRITGLPPGAQAYNPSCARFEGEMVVAVRVDMPATRGRPNMQVAIAPMGASYSTTQSVALLDLRQAPGVNHTAEDPRLFVANKSFYVAYNSTPHGLMRPPRLMQLAKLRIEAPGGPSERTLFTVEWNKTLHFVPLLTQSTEAAPKIEKNWSPFACDDTICFVYQHSRTRIGRIDPEALNAPEKTLDVIELMGPREQVPYAFGEIRGGTPLVPVLEMGGLVGAFHGAVISDFGNGLKHHHTIGIAVFRPSPPFDIVRVMPAPIYLKDADAPPMRRCNAEIAFAAGIERDGDDLLITYGKNDIESRILRVGIAELCEELVATKKAYTTKDSKP